MIIITNQSGIAKGYYTLAEFNYLNDWMLDSLETQGIHINKVYYCPHHPDAKIPEFRVDCDCRKPKLGLYNKAIEEFHLDLNECYAIGDKIRDCSICATTNCHGFLIAQNEKKEIINDVKNGQYRNVKYATNLKQAILMIMDRKSKNIQSSIHSMNENYN